MAAVRSTPVALLAALLCSLPLSAQEVPGARGSSAIELAEHLAQSSDQLRAALAPAPGAWRAMVPGPGAGGELRQAGRGLLGASLPQLANGVLSIADASRPGVGLSLKALGLRAVPFVETTGRVVYTDVAQSTDLLVTRSGHQLEWFMLLYDAQAPTRFEWEAELSPAVREVRADGNGGLVLVDAEARPVLAMPRPFAVDARGARRDAALTWERGRLVLSLDPRGLAFPVLLDLLVDLAVWERKATGIVPRAHAAAVYDSVRKQVVTFGGDDGANILTSTATWNGTGWTTVSNGGPAKRSYHAMAFDSGRGVAVLFGGILSSPLGPTNQLWEWDGATWTQASPLNPPSARSQVGMAYDSVRGVTVVFGGSIFGSVSAETWEWNGTVWTKKTPTASPPARYGHAMAFDPLRKRVVIHGGWTGSGPNAYGDTWEYDGTTWVNIGGTGPMLMYTTMAWDEADSRMVLYGGWTGAGAYNGTWERIGTTWSAVTTNGTPPARYYASMAYDVARSRLVLLSGFDNVNALGDTWEFLHRQGCTIAADCPTPTNACQSAVCTVATGLCTTAPKTNGTACDDSSACTAVDSCQAGTCTGGSPTVCTAVDQCHTVGVCDPSTGTCSNPAKTNGSTCSDSDACTVGDQCIGGFCLGGTATVCTASDQCHQAGVCNPSTGQCSNPAAVDGTGCDDADACTSGEHCQGGSCGTPGTTVSCGPLDQCHLAGACAPSTGLCSNPRKVDGTSCDDADACTLGERCVAGTCGTPSSTVTCGPVDECHVGGACNPSTGACTSPGKADGAPCLGGSCQGQVCVPAVDAGVDAGPTDDAGQGGGAGGGTGGGGGAGGGATGGGSGTDAGERVGNGPDAGPDGEPVGAARACGCSTATPLEAAVLLGALLVLRRRRGTSPRA